MKTWLKNISVFFLLFVLVFTSVPKESLAERTILNYGNTKTIGNSASTSTISSAVDYTGNVYMLGIFSAVTDFNPLAGVDEHDTVGGYDVFLTKINADGTYGYTKTFGGLDVDSFAALSVDSSGNVYVGINFSSGTIDLDPSVGVDEYTNLGGVDIALVKINADGTYGYSKHIGGADTETLSGIANDTDGNVYLIGTFNGTTDFNPSGGVDTEIADASNNAFLTKINSDGTYGYTNVINQGDVTAFAIAVDSDSGRVYIVGYFGGTADFDPSGVEDLITAVGTQNADGFLTELNLDGSYVDTKTFVNDSSLLITYVAVSSNGDVFLSGNFFAPSDPIDFNPGVGEDLHVSALNSSDAFLTKFNADGSYGWTKIFGGGNGDDGEYYRTAESIAFDENDNIYISGFFSGTFDIDPSNTEELHTAGVGNGYNIFFAKIDTNGELVYGESMGVEDAINLSNSISVDSENNFYISGYFSDPFDFNPLAGEDVHAPLGVLDAYLTKFSQTIYHYINSLSGTLLAETTDGTSVDDEEVDDGILLDEVAQIRIKDGTLPLADISTTFLSDLDWSTVTGDSDTEEHKAFIHNLTEVDGADTDFTLYVPYRANDVSVTVCSGATSLEEVSADCDGAVSYQEGESGVTIVTIGDNQFWSIPGQTGTGGISVAPARRGASGSMASPSAIAKALVNSPVTTTPLTPTPQTNTQFQFLKNLKYKMNDPDVKELQKYLNTHGFPVSLVGAGSLNNETNLFGPKTKSAVILFQKSKGLVLDGIVGPMTRGELNK
jgi:hypothetical protein